MMFERLMNRLSMAIGFGLMAVPAVAETDPDMSLSGIADQLDRFVIFQCEANSDVLYFPMEKGEAGELTPLYPKDSFVTTSEGSVYISDGVEFHISAGDFSYEIGDKKLKGTCRSVSSQLAEVFRLVDKSRAD